MPIDGRKHPGAPTPSQQQQHHTHTEGGRRGRTFTRSHAAHFLAPVNQEAAIDRCATGPLLGHACRTRGGDAAASASPGGSKGRARPTGYILPVHLFQPAPKECGNTKDAPTAGFFWSNGHQNAGWSDAKNMTTFPKRHRAQRKKRHQSDLRASLNLRLLTSFVNRKGR